MSSRTTKQPSRPVSADERLDRNVVDDSIKRIPNRVEPNNAFTEIKKTGNAYELQNGEYPGGQFSTPKGSVTGQGASSFTKEHKVASSGEYTFSGCVFENTVEVSGKVVYNSCRFEKAVSVAAGAKAIFNGCIFTDDGKVTNAAGVADCVVIGCMRIGTGAHVNVTLIGEVV
tara:strand:- start:45 stop:560 length:516 start_codon:yes stop_codon:yes gene_type:complete